MQKSVNSPSRLSGIHTTSSSLSSSVFTPTLQVASSVIRLSHSHLSLVTHFGTTASDTRDGDGSYGEADFISLSDFTVRSVLVDKQKLSALSVIHMVSF